MTSIRKFLSRAALGTFVASLFFASTSHAQVRQTSLYIDDGSGHFNILQADPVPQLGGTYLFPSTGGTNNMIITTANLSDITGGTSFTPGGVFYGITASTMGTTGAGTTNQVLISNGASAPSWAPLPGGSGNYIQNQSSVQQPTSSFWISGSGEIDGVLNATGSIQNTTSNPLLISTVNGELTTIGNPTGTTTMPGIVNATGTIQNTTSNPLLISTVNGELTTIGNPTGTTTMPGTVNASGSIQNTTSNPLLISTVNGELTTIGNPTGTTTMPGTVNATGSIQNTTSNPLLISTVNGELTTIGNPTGTTTMPGTVNATGSIQNTTSNPLLISTVNGELTTIGNPTGTTTMPGTVNATGSIQNTTSNPLLISTVNGETTTIGNPTGTTTMPGIVNATGSIENTTSNPLLISTANGETTKIGNPTGTTTMPGIVNATGSIENTTVAGTLDISTASGEATTIGNLTGTTTIQGPGVDLPGLATAAPLNGILGLNGSNQVVISNAAIVEGSGTQNTLPKWNNAGGTTLGDSKLTDDGTDLVYNTAFDVSSSGAVSGVTTLEASTSVQDDALSTAGIVTNTGAGLLGTVAEVPVANGGTGAALSLATGDLITASSSTAFTNLADVATGSVLVSGGVGTTPKWSTLGNIAVTSITGTANEINPVALSTGAVTLSLPSTLVAPGTFEATTSIKDDGLTAAGIVTNTAGGALGTETLVPLANGGTDADLSGQGGAHEVLEQFTNGGAVTVGQLANTDITGLGTMSTQDADAVDITGGTIDGTVIGGTSPAAGSFTTLNASTSETFTNLSTAGIVTNTAGGVLGTETLGTVAVTSAAGTANEVLVDGTSGTAETGAVTLSLPSTLVAPGTFEATTSIKDDGLTAGVVTSDGSGNLGSETLVPVANGGTGAALSLATGDLITASSSTAFTNLADVATGSVLVSGGLGASPSWSSLGSIAVTSITGTANEINPVALSTGAVTLSLPSTLVAPGTFEATTSIKDDGLTAAGIVTNTAGGALGTETLVPLANGGTDADLSGQGGAHEVLEQFTNGGAVTVGQLANTDITGLGTMSTQDADAVDITGGTIDGTVIGGTSPAAGSFTTLNASTSETFTNLSTAGIVTNTAGGVLGTETLGSVAVTSATGTANEVLVDGTSGTAETGDITLTLPTTLVAPGTFEATTSIQDDGLTTAGIVTNTAGGALGTETLVPLANGGTDADLSGQGGPHEVLEQFTNGGAVTVAQLANTDITGLGTMSTQDADAVAITGGSITGTTISGSTGSFTTLTSTGNSTIGTAASTTNTFGNGGNANNSIGDGGSATNSFGSVGGSITNSFGDGASAINTFGIGASASNTIGSTGTSITTILGGTGVGINNADTSSGPTNIGNGASTGSVSIGNTTGGVTITSTSWSASGAALTAGSATAAGSLALTDGAVGDTYTLEAATGGSFSPTFLLPTETGPGPYTLATVDQIPNGTNYIKNQDAGEQVGANFDIEGSGTLGGTLTVNGGFIEGANPLDIQDEAGALNLGNNSSPITMEGPVDIDYTTTFAVSSGNDITGTAGWNVDNAGNANFVSIGTGTPGTGAFSTLAVGSTGQLTVGAAGDLSTSGTIATTGTSGITSAGPLKASGTLVYSTEGPFDATSNAVAVTGTTVFAEVNGTPTGTVTLTVTNGSPATGQVLLIYNSTTEPLELNSQYVFPSYTGKFIYYGSQWILMQN